jgi:hypothetical protein
MQTVKFADRLNAIASNDDLNSKRRFADANVPLSPIQAAARSDDHAALLKRVIASARLLRIDFDPSSPSISTNSTPNFQKARITPSAWP